QKWLQPGGHADGDGRLQAVALKEALEETGIADLQVWPRAIDVDVHEVVDKRAKEIVHLHLDVRFLIKAPQSAVARRNHESLDLRWVAREELNDPRLALDPSTQRVANYGFALADQLMH
ncbi:MAG TPA: NUDIX hydrolase, partial [Acidimicrobiaceae bacterium]|nr:NUDIX hydrolase [Acidimicrobiaceae bacterium]